MNSIEDIKRSFKAIDPDQKNIDSIYSVNKRIWFYRNSDKRNDEIDAKINSDEGIAIADIPFDNHKDGFKLNTEDFIDESITDLKSLDTSQLSFGEKRQYEYYLTYLERRKLHINYNNDNGFNFVFNQENQVDEYKKGIWSGYFSNVIDWTLEGGKLSELHYTKLTSSWAEQRNKQLDENPILKERIKLLKGYNQTMQTLMNDTMEFFSIVHAFNHYYNFPFDVNGFNMKIFNVKLTLKSITEFPQIINFNISTGHYKLALQIQQYCLLMFDNVVSIIDDRFFLNVYDTPLGIDFTKARNAIENAVDLEKLKMLASSKDGEVINSVNAVKNKYIDFLNLDGIKAFKPAYKEPKLGEEKED